MLNYFKQKKRQSTDELNDQHNNISSSDEFGIYNLELKQILSKELEALGESCKEILRLWSHSYSMREIKTKLNIASEEATRKRKHICLKKLLSNIEARKSVKGILASYLNKNE